MPLIGTFGGTNYDLYRSRFIYAPSAPPPVTSAAPPPPPAVPVPFVPRIISPAPTFPLPGFLPTPLPPVNVPPITSAPIATGPSTGLPSGGTTTTDTSRLLDLIAANFKPQDISGSLAPVSVSDTATTTGKSQGGTNPLALLILVVAVIAGIVWYMKHKKAKVA